MDGKKEDRLFQLALLETQLELEHYFGLLVTLLAIVYSLLIYFGDNLLALILLDGVILAVGYGITEHYKNLRIEYIKDLRKRFIEEL